MLLTASGQHEPTTYMASSRQCCSRRFNADSCSSREAVSAAALRRTSASSRRACGESARRGVGVRVCVVAGRNGCAGCHLCCIRFSSYSCCLFLLRASNGLCVCGLASGVLEVLLTYSLTLMRLNCWSILPSMKATALALDGMGEEAIAAALQEGERG